MTMHLTQEKYYRRHGRGNLLPFCRTEVQPTSDIFKVNLNLS